MNYSNYELKIVELYGVALEGWPGRNICNPSSIGHRVDLESLHQSLAGGICKWVKLTEEQSDARMKAQLAKGEVSRSKLCAQHKPTMAPGEEKTDDQGSDSE